MQEPPRSHRWPSDNRADNQAHSEEHPTKRQMVVFRMTNLPIHEVVLKRSKRRLFAVS
jgi:hypothetical protein